MAVTYIQQPTSGSIQSSDNPIPFVFSGSNIAQPNFCFIVETYVNGTIASTDMIFAEKGSRAHYDAINVTLPYLKPSPRSTGLATLQNLPTMYIKVAERYGTTPVTHAFTQSNTIKLVKACTNEESFALDWITDKYTPSEKWITNAPNVTLLLSKKYPVWASIFNSQPDVQVEVYTYDADGINNGILSSGMLATADRVNVQVTPAMIEAEIAPLTMADVARMDIYMNQSDPLHVIFIDEDCGEFHQLSWLNNMGAYDQMLFTHNRDQESAIQIQEYKKQFGNWTTSNTFEHDPLKSGDTPYSKTIQPTGSIYSGWIAEAYQNWLSEIFDSVDAILLEGDQIERIIVTDTKATKDKHRFMDILNFQVNYKKSNFKSITQ